MVSLLRFVFFSILAGKAVSHTILRDLTKRDFLNERSTDDLFLPDSENIISTGDTSSYDSDPLLFSDSGDVALQPSDQASAVACDGTQSNLDLFLDSPTSLNARDLTDEFPGLRDLVAPLDQLKDSCTAPVGQQENTGGPTPSGGNNQQPDLLAPPLESQTNHPEAGDCSGVGEDYIYALCCDGARIGDYVLGCSSFNIFLRRCYVPGQQYCCKIYHIPLDSGQFCQNLNWGDNAPIDPSRPPGSVPYNHGDTWFGNPGFNGD